jgi:hypothetical protein
MLWALPERYSIFFLPQIIFLLALLASQLKIYSESA